MNQFKQPQQRQNYNNEIRKAGFELEFSNIDMQNIVEILTKECFLEPKKINNYLYKFASKYGNYTLELDFELLTQQKFKKNITKLSKSLGVSIEQKELEELESFIGKLSKDIVPYEISTPPIPLDKLDTVEQLIKKLSQNNAKGTTEKLYYAFGLHINLEVISLESSSLLDYLKAYTLLQDFLNKDAKVDLARKITPFIDNFKKEYIQYILNPEYTPSQKEFIQDYLQFNPTRNRSLDMLPILAYIDEDLVRKTLPDEKIKPRPTFHYRLSNSMIGEENWKVADEWNRWLLVEKLANDKKSLEKLSSKYLNHLDNFISITTWETQIEQWIQNHL